MDNKCVELIKSSLHNQACDIEIDESTMNELVEQAIYCLPAAIMHSLRMSEDMRLKWKNAIVRQVQNYHKALRDVEEVTNQLQSNGITPVVLKGVSVAMYYEHPEYRAVGDIDIILSPNNSETVAQAKTLLADIGYQEEVHDDNRHTTFRRDKSLIELHNYFSDKRNESDILLDKIIDESPVVERSLEGKRFYSFDDSINGLVVLQHIQHHLDCGIGFRQIIDWLMFARTCLYNNPEETEKYFKLTERVGLKRLAIHVQRLGEIYFDMPQQELSSEADDEAVNELFERLVYYGNFGSKVDHEKRHSIVVLRYFFPDKLHFKSAEKWREEHADSALKYLAWPYQIVRYAKIGTLRITSGIRALGNYKDMKQQSELLEKLEVSKYRK